MSFSVEVMPRGSSTIKQPLELSFGGPFTRGGAGKPPESDFTITISGQGHHGSLQVISAGGKGYITVSGQSYELPASNFKSVESGLGSLPSSGGTSGVKTDTSALSKLGIHPLDWLSDPKIVMRKSSIGGGATTWIHATVDTTAMLQDLSKLLAKSGSLGIAGANSLPKSISATTRKRLAKALGSPTFNVWTGASDKILRNLIVRATIPITGQTRTGLGGTTSVVVTLAFGYTEVNQPQTITAPTSVEPYSVLRSKVAALLKEIEDALLTGSPTAGTTTTGTTTTGTTTTGTTTSSIGTTTISGVTNRYSACISNAAGDVRKMLKCAPLLGSG
jgi:hypothetical protein